MLTTIMMTMIRGSVLIFCADVKCCLSTGMRLQVSLKEGLFNNANVIYRSVMHPCSVTYKHTCHFQSSDGQSVSSSRMLAGLLELFKIQFAHANL